MSDYWPRLRLTREESQYISKYYEPKFGRRGVLRRSYPGSLSLTLQQRTPQFNFQIGRRCRVFALTASGDTSQFLVQLITATGEKHTPDFVDLALLLEGWGGIPQSATFPTVTAGVNTSQPAVTPSNGQAYIMDPNIVLEPNQTLTINGGQTQDYSVFNSDFRIDFSLHVWEFPGMPGSPL